MSLPNKSKSQQLRLVGLPRYGKLAASTRQRFDQYAPFLQKSGFEIESWPLFDDAYLRRQYAGSRSGALYTAKRYLNRATLLARGKNIDLLWIGYEVFPYFPGFFDLIATLPNAAIVLDFDDAIFHNYDTNKHPIIGRLLGERLAPLLRRADTALCGNEYIRSYVSQYCRETHIVPTILDTNIYRPTKHANRVSGQRLRIGWLGTPSTWDAYVAPLLPALLDEAERADAEIFAVGSGKAGGSHPRLVRKDWVEADEVSDIQSMDVCIMPLDDSPWAQGKCGYKLIQYMACGLPVIASPIGVNNEIVDPGKNGFLAQNEQEWREAIALLLSDEALRGRMGKEGRIKIERDYSLKYWGPKVGAILRQAATEQGPD